MAVAGIAIAGVALATAGASLSTRAVMFVAGIGWVASGDASVPHSGRARIYRRPCRSQAAYLAQRTAAVTARLDATEAWRTQVAQTFQNDPSQRAIVHPSPTMARCEIATARGRIRFHVKHDRGIARDVNPEAFQCFQMELQVKTEVAKRTRAEQETVHAERRRLVHEWIGTHGTPDQEARVSAGMLPLEEGIEAMTAATFRAVGHFARDIRDGASRLQAHLRRHPRYSDAVVTPDTLTVTSRTLTKAMASRADPRQWCRSSGSTASPVGRDASGPWCCS